MTPAEEAILAQFHDLTAYTEAQRDQVLLLMEQCHWDLAMACGRYFDSGLPDQQPDVAPTAAPQALPLDMLDTFPTGMSLVYPRAIPISIKWKFHPGLVHAPSTLTWILMLVPNMLFWMLSKLGELLGLYRADRYAAAPLPPLPTLGPEPHNDITDVCHVLSTEKVDLPVWSGEFNDAFQLAKREHQFLLMILVDLTAPVSDLTRTFLEMVFSSEFSDYIHNKNVVVYLGNVAHPEAHCVAQTYGVTKTPHVSLIASVHSGDFVVLKRWDNVMNMLLLATGGDSSTQNLARKWIGRLSRVMDIHDPNLVVLRAEKQERDLARILREEQDQQYQETLARDRELAKQRKEEEASAKERLLQQQQEESRKQMTSVKRQALECALLAQFAAKHAHPVEGPSTKIQFRWQDGTRVVHAFGEAQTCRDVFEYVAGMNAKETHTQQLECTAQEIADFDSSYDFTFTLTSPMPRLKLSPCDAPLREVRALWPNGSLLVERDEEDLENENSN